MNISREERQKRKREKRQKYLLWCAQFGLSPIWENEEEKKEFQTRLLPNHRCLFCNLRKEHTHEYQPKGTQEEAPPEQG